MEFNHADLFEGVADAIPDRVALVCGDRKLTFAEMDAEANRLAHHLVEAGVEPGQHVAIQLYNCVEYVAAMLAVLKIRAVPINVNYRYVKAELRYLYQDSDAVALLYDVEFEDRVATTAPEAPKLRHLIAVGGATSVPGAMTYADAVAGQPATRGFPKRAGSDLYVIYTGGTTGMPKGVMWRTEDMFFAFANPMLQVPKTPEAAVEQSAAGGPLIMFPVPPLMHGASQMATLISWLWTGATIVYVRKFDAAEVLRTIEREKVNSITITGDAMAGPIADELAKGGYDLSSLFAFVSTGAIFSGSIRQRIQDLLPNVMIMDRFGSTESGSTAEATADSSPEKGLKFAPDIENVTVLDESLRQVEPGSGVMGQVARSGYIPIGYYNDPEKTAKTFPEVDGKRWLLTGDIATVEADGTIAVFGRGSQAINTGGEKVFPEEVEAVLKGHPDVADAVVTGIPDPRFGSRVAAVVQARGAVPSTEDLDRHCREQLSGYKVPRAYAFVDEMQRSPAGKADYRWAKRVAEKSA